MPEILRKIRWIRKNWREGQLRSQGDKEQRGDLTREVNVSIPVGIDRY